MELSGDFFGTVKQDRQYMAGESQPGVSSKDMAAKIGYGKLPEGDTPFCRLHGKREGRVSSL